MITKSQAYQTSDGQTHATLELAQRAELFALLAPATSLTDAQNETLVSAVFANAPAIVAILNSTGRKPRKKGAKKSATAKA